MAGLTNVLKSAPAATDQMALIDKRSGKRKVVSAKVRKAIALVLDGHCRTLQAAAERAGLSNGRLSRALREPHIRQYLDEAVRGALADVGKAMAAGRMLDLINAESENVSFFASKHVLAISNIRPPEQRPGMNVQINNNIQPGYVVDLSVWAPLGEDAGRRQKIGPDGVIEYEVPPGPPEAA